MVGFMRWTQNFQAEKQLVMRALSAEKKWLEHYSFADWRNGNYDCLYVREFENRRIRLEVRLEDNEPDYVTVDISAVSVLPRDAFYLRLRFAISPGVKKFVVFSNETKKDSPFY
jgi:hypothetical protein